MTALCQAGLQGWRGSGGRDLAQAPASLLRSGYSPSGAGFHCRFAAATPLEPWPGAHRVQPLWGAGGFSVRRPLEQARASAFFWPAELEPGPSITLLASASRNPSHPLGTAPDLNAKDRDDALFLAGLWDSITAGDTAGVAAPLETASGFSARLEFEQTLFGPPTDTRPLWDLSECERVFALLQNGGLDLGQLLPASRLSATWRSDREFGARPPR